MAETTERVLRLLTLLRLARACRDAFDVDRDDWRVFRLDRMSAVEATTWRFRGREHPDPVGHVQRAVTTAAYPVQARVRMHAPADEVSRTLTSTSATVTPLDERAAGSVVCSPRPPIVETLGAWDSPLCSPRCSSGAPR